MSGCHFFKVVVLKWTDRGIHNQPRCDHGGGKGHVTEYPLLQEGKVFANTNIPLAKINQKNSSFAGLLGYGR